MDKTKEMMILTAMAEEMSFSEEVMPMTIYLDYYEVMGASDVISLVSSSSEVKRIALEIIKGEMKIYEGGYKLSKPKSESMTISEETEPTLNLPYIEKFLDKFC